MTDIVDLGIRISSAEAKKGATDLDALTAAAGRTEAATNRTTAAVQRMDPPLRAVRQSIRLAGNGARQFAQHMSQAAQQGAVTGNYLQALAYQIPDLGLRFGVLGIGITAVAGVVLPALITAFQNTIDKSRATKDAIEALNAQTKDFFVTSQAAKFGVDENEIALITEVNRLLGEKSRLQKEFAESEGVLDRLARGRIAEEYNANLRLLETAARSIAAYREARSEAEKHASVSTRIAAMQQQIAAHLSRQDGILSIINPKFLSMRGAVESVASAGGRLPGIFGAAQGVASGLASTLWNGARAAWAMAQGMAAGRANYEATGDRTGLTGPDAVRSEMQGGGRFTPPVLGAGLPAIPGAGGGGGGSGGGGGGTDDFAQRLEDLRNELAGEQEVVDEWYTNAQAILADRRATEILGEEAHRMAIQEVEKRHQEKLAEIQATAQNQRLSQVSNFFGAVQGIIEAGGKGAAKAAAIAGGIQATINAYVAATEALRQPGLGLFGRLAAYASVLGTGLKAVAAIRSAGGVGGGAVAAQGAAGGATAEPQQRVSVFGVRADDLFTGRMIYDMFAGEARFRGSRIVELIG